MRMTLRARMYMENADITLHDLDADILFYHCVHDLPLPVQASGAGFERVSIEFVPESHPGLGAFSKFER